MLTRAIIFTITGMLLEANISGKNLHSPFAQGDIRSMAVVDSGSL